MYKCPIQFKHLFFEDSDDFNQGFRFVDLVVIFLQNEDSLGSYIGPRSLFCRHPPVRSGM